MSHSRIICEERTGYQILQEVMFTCIFSLELVSWIITRCRVSPWVHKDLKIVLHCRIIWQEEVFSVINATNRIALKHHKRRGRKNWGIKLTETPFKTQKVEQSEEEKEKASDPRRTLNRKKGNDTLRVRKTSSGRESFSLNYKMSINISEQQHQGQWNSNENPRN